MMGTREASRNVFIPQRSKNNLHFIVLYNMWPERPTTIKYRVISVQRSNHLQPYSWNYRHHYSSIYMSSYFSSSDYSSWKFSFNDWNSIYIVFNTYMIIIHQWYVSHPVFCGYLWSPIKWPSVERQASLDRQSVTEGVVCVLWVSSRLILITRKSWVTSW